MKYLLDTHIISEIYDPNAQWHQKIRGKIEDFVEEDFYISTLTLFELHYGLANAPAEKQERLQRIINNVHHRFGILELKKESAPIFGALKSALKKIRNLNKKAAKKHNMDLMLASSAIQESCILVSGDKIFFTLAEINSKLTIENWLNPE